MAQQTVGCLTADGLQSQAVVASDSAAGAAGVQVPTFAIDTPGQVAVPTGHSVDVLWLDEQAQLAIQEYAVSYTELTEDMDDRMALVTEVLSHMEGATQQGLAFVVKVENTVKEYRDYYGELVAADPENAKIPLQLWAMERLTQLSSSDFEEYEDLKRHVYALGKIAERPIEGCRRLAQNMWETSDYGTPALYGGQGVVVQPSCVVPGAGRSPDRVMSPVLRPDTPGAVTSVDVVHICQAMQDGFKDTMSAVIQKMDERPKDEDGSNIYRSEKLQAVMGLDFKKSLPTIQDNDADMDKYDQEFDHAMVCYSYGGRKMRDIDRLFMYEDGFPVGSTRRKVYQNSIRKAKRLNRLPEEAVEIMKEVRKELRTFIWETVLQKMTRLDREFEALMQGLMTHADFRALWDSKLQDMEESGMDMPTASTLYRKYLGKIQPELRTRIMAKEWKIDGPDTPARNPQTHQDIAMAAGLCLEERADIHAAGSLQDGFMMFEGQGGPGTGPKIPTAGGGRARGQGPGPSPTICSYCHAVGDHYTAICPQRCADKEQHKNPVGVLCEFCQSPSHLKRHHLQGSMDASNQGGGGAKGGQGGGAKGGGRGGSKGGKEQSQQGRGGKDPKGQGRGQGPSRGKNTGSPIANNLKTETCPYGPRCYHLRDYGHCPKWHERWEEQEAQQKRRDAKANQLAADAWNRRQNKGTGSKSGTKGSQKGGTKG